MKLKLFGNEEKLRKQQIELISMLNRWYQVREDMLFAFEKCLESDLSEPAITYVGDFVTRVKCGMDIPGALDMLSESYDDPSFRYFIKQIGFNLKYRGNTGELLDDLESEFIRVDEEYTRRKISTSRDRTYLKIIFLAVPIISAYVLLTNRSANEFFVFTTMGNMAAAASVLIYLTGLIYSILTERKNGR